MATSPHFSKKRSYEESSAVEELLTVPDSPSEEQLQRYFYDLAQALLRKVELIVKAGDKQRRFRLLEIELYYQSEESHPDPFCHARAIQAHPGLFYFHRAGNKESDLKASTTEAGGYRGGTRKGLDVSFGNAEARAGLLLRSVQDLEDESVICGPSKIVDAILSFNKASNIRSLIELYDGDVSVLPSALDHDLCLALNPASASETAAPTIYASPRIGLDLARASKPFSSSDPRVIYVDKPYRFFTRPKLLRSAGRPHTFLSLYLHPLPDQSQTIEEYICSTGGYTKKVVEQYGAAYEAGKKAQVESYLEKKGSLSATEWLKMVGALRAARDAART